MEGRGEVLHKEFVLDPEFRSQCRKPKEAVQQLGPYPLCDPSQVGPGPPLRRTTATRRTSTPGSPSRPERWTEGGTVVSLCDSNVCMSSPRPHSEWRPGTATPTSVSETGADYAGVSREVVSWSTVYLATNPRDTVVEGPSPSPASRISLPYRPPSLHSNLHDSVEVSPSLVPV